MRIRDLRKCYGDNVVLDRVSFDVHRGMMNVIVGASGSGKTVLLRQLLRLDSSDGGRIELDGQDLVALDEVALLAVRKKMGVVFQDSALLDSQSVFDNVAFPLREGTSRIDARIVRGKVFTLLEALGVAAAADKYPAELSGGMKKRVAIARALVGEPELLVYDEPTRGLDPLTARSVDSLIAATGRQFGVTSVMISHDIKSVFDIADRVSLLREGRIEESLDKLSFFTSTNPNVRAFLDASGVRFARPAPPGPKS